jgi:hypothetical protein
VEFGRVFRNVGYQVLVREKAIVVTVPQSTKDVVNAYMSMVTPLYSSLLVVQSIVPRVEISKPITVAVY